MIRSVSNCYVAMETQLTSYADVLLLIVAAKGTGMQEW